MSTSPRGVAAKNTSRRLSSRNKNGSCHLFHSNTSAKRGMVWVSSTNYWRDDMAQTKPKKRGLGSDSIDEKTKHRIQSMGGKASHGGGRKSES